MGFWSFLFRKKPREIKLGLALGSGGAKGFAELGALKAFEENGISFDYFAGTSIGSIIGAFTAEGYSSTDCLEFLKRLDFSQIKSQFMINMDTAGLFNALDTTIGSKNIEELKKPFVAIATDMDTKKEVVFDKGSCALALCASSCYPPFFKPVIVNDKRYIDGAFTNSLPADKVKKMGADYIVAIDLSNHEAKKSNNILFKLLPTFEGEVEKPWQVGYDNADIVLHPDLTAYKPISVGEASAMYDIGYQCAIDNIPKIKSDIEKLKFSKKKK